MPKYAVLYFFSAMFYTSHCFDASKIDYCNLAECKNRNHVACYCNPMKSREEVGLPTLKFTFRSKVTHLHNEYRNNIASGEEKRVPQASNMMVLNYDMELEHIARCQGLGRRDTKDPGTCRVTSTGETVGQNHCACNLGYERSASDVPPGVDVPPGGLQPEMLQAATTQTPSTSPKIFDFTFADTGPYVTEEPCIASWYQEIKRVSNGTIKPFIKKEASTFQHFTQMVWAHTTHLGCVKVWNRNHLRESWKVLFLCKYKNAGNVENDLVYETGNGCSACPSGTKCETKEYPFLCGRLQPIPKDDATVDTSGDKEAWFSSNSQLQNCLQNWVLIIASGFFVVFVI